MTTVYRNDPVLPRKPKARQTLEESGALAAARAAQADVHAAEARKLAAAVEWAALHEVTDPDDAENWGEESVTLAGAGAPLVARGCIGEFAAVIGTSTFGGRHFIADALELKHRLPRLYARIQDGTLPAWKGRRIAHETTVLPAEAAADLDERMAPIAGRLSATATQQMIAETIVAVMPAYAQDLVDRSWIPEVVINHRQVSFVRTSRFSGALDLLDAQDLDVRLDEDALNLQASGRTEPLAELRAVALGMLARGETIEGAAVPRTVQLVVHLPADTNPSALVEVEEGRLVTEAQIAAWCGNPEVKVVVKPVIDLHDRLSARGYDIPDKIREHLELRDGTCIYPHCTRPARYTQKDHICPFDHSDPERCPTCTDNLACLCQQHHNLKTHGGWTYVMVVPGAYLWRSPHGYFFLRDQYGTRDVTPRPVEPPGS